jgi:xanthine dehydrogenase accessory factor
MTTTSTSTPATPASPCCGSDAAELTPATTAEPAPAAAVAPPLTGGVDERSRDLLQQRVPHVVARVVLAQRPTSARPGATAVVLADGTIEGFVGGTCAESTLRERAAAVLDHGEPELVRITPEPDTEVAAHPGKVVVHNPCLSGGTLELFLEPHTPAPLVAVAGDAPIARALTTIGAHLGYDLRPASDPLPPDTAAVVVAAHGRGEEPVLEAALRAGVPYVGLVASPTRGTVVVASLDVDDEAKARVHTPAGLDLGARTPEEVAVSILAELIAVRPRPAAPVVPSAPHLSLPLAAPADAAPRFAHDPVCGMTVEVAASSLWTDHQGRRVWFCGRGCQRAFVAEPDAYPTGPSDGPTSAAHGTSAHASVHDPA